MSYTFVLQQKLLSDIHPRHVIAHKTCNPLELGTMGALPWEQGVVSTGHRTWVNPENPLLQCGSTHILFIACSEQQMLPTNRNTAQAASSTCGQSHSVVFLTLANPTLCTVAVNTVWKQKMSRVGSDDNNKVFGCYGARCGATWLQLTVPSSVTVDVYPVFMDMWYFVPKCLMISLTCKSYTHQHNN